MMILALVRNYIPSHHWVRRRRLEHRGLRLALVRPRRDAGRHGRRRPDRLGRAAAAEAVRRRAALHRPHRLPAEVEQELGVTFHPTVESLVERLRRRHDQRAAASRDRAPLRRRADRPDEARRLSDQHRARQDLRPRRGRARARERSARRLRRRRLVPAAGAAGSSVADDAASRHDAAHLGLDHCRRRRATRPAPARSSSAGSTDSPIRDEYLIVDGGKLAGAGAHSYSAGNATGGSEEAARFTAT